MHLCGCTCRTHIQSLGTEADCVMLVPFWRTTAKLLGMMSMEPYKPRSEVQSSAKTRRGHCQSDTATFEVLAQSGFIVSGIYFQFETFDVIHLSRHNKVAPNFNY